MILTRMVMTPCPLVSTSDRSRRAEFVRARDLRQVHEQEQPPHELAREYLEVGRLRFEDPPPCLDRRETGDRAPEPTPFGPASRKLDLLAHARQPLHPVPEPLAAIHAVHLAHELRERHWWRDQREGGEVRRVRHFSVS